MKPRPCFTPTPKEWDWIKRVARIRYGMLGANPKRVDRTRHPYDLIIDGVVGEWAVCKWLGLAPEKEIDLHTIRRRGGDQGVDIWDWLTYTLQIKFTRWPTGVLLWAKGERPKTDLTVLVTSTVKWEDVDVAPEVRIAGWLWLDDFKSRVVKRQITKEVGLQWVVDQPNLKHPDVMLGLREPALF